MYYSLSVDFQIDDPNQANAIQGVCLHGPAKRLAEWNVKKKWMVKKKKKIYIYILYIYIYIYIYIVAQCYACTGESLHFLPLNGQVEW